MKKAFPFFLLIVCMNAFSQNMAAFTKESTAFMNDANGRPLYLQVNYNIEGSPFYPDNYRFATIITPNGTVYRNIRTKINMQENLVLYKTNEGDEMVATTAIQGILFTEIIDGKQMNILFRNGYNAVDKQTEATFYQVVDSGVVSLLKLHKVTYNDRKAYGNASITRVFDVKEIYYISLPGNDVKRLEKGKDAIINLLPANREKITAFISQQNLSCRSEADWKKVLEYYRTLP